MTGLRPRSFAYLLGENVKHDARGKLPRTALPSFVLQKTFVPSKNKIKCDGREQRKVKEVEMIEKNEYAGGVGS